MLLIPPYKIKFKGMYISVWLSSRPNKYINFYCQKTPDGRYYIPLVFNSYKSLYDVEKYVNKKILDRYGVNLLNWHKAIHVKYFYEVINSEGKYMEVWTEYNYNPDKDMWISVCDWNGYDKIYELSEGLPLYRYLPFRFVGSWFTMKFIILRSDYTHQFLLKSII